MDMFFRFIALVPVTLVQGLIYALVALAVMIPFRLLNFPDLSCEGSFPLGGCICGALLATGASPVAAMMLGMVGGFFAGMAVAMISRHFRINSLLAGIIVVTMLYSINLRTLGRSNVALFEFPNIFDQIRTGLNESLSGKVVALGVMIAIVTAALYLFMRTELGVAFRAVGANAEMTEAQGISVAAMRLLGMGIAAALSALAGAIVVQSQGYADVNIGFGVVINALAAVIIGELLLGRAPVHRQLLAPILGSIVYAQVVSMCLAIGLAPTDLKLASGLLVLAMLALPRLMGRERAAERDSGFSGS
jgi:putative tryptophan/tyrosine transport system permease protein